MEDKITLDDWLSINPRPPDAGRRRAAATKSRRRNVRPTGALASSAPPLKKSAFVAGVAEGMAKAAADMTQGEYEMDASAPGITGRSRHELRPQKGLKLMVGRGTGRGVPEWVSLLTRPPGQTVDTLPDTKTGA